MPAGIDRTEPQSAAEEVPAPDDVDLVYFSSVSGNTRRFAEKLDRPAARIPLRPRLEGTLRAARPFVLMVPTYGGGHPGTAVPKQVIRFLNIPENRHFLRGVIAAGNTNFGADYCLAGPVISNKCQVPVLYRFELLGTARDVAQVDEGLARFWEELGPGLPHDPAQLHRSHPTHPTHPTKDRHD